MRLERFIYRSRLFYILLKLKLKYLWNIKVTEISFCNWVTTTPCTRKNVCVTQGNERIGRKREREERGYSTLVPSDLALMRFNTRAIITRYRYNGAASRCVPVFCMHVLARTGKIFATGCSKIANRNLRYDQRRQKYPYLRKHNLCRTFTYYDFLKFQLL